jgi:hypothetical protein
MKKTRLSVLLSLAALILLPGFLRADCTELGKFTSWVLKDTHTIIFYLGKRPLAMVYLPDCDHSSGGHIFPPPPPLLYPPSGRESDVPPKTACSGGNPGTSGRRKE